MSPTRPLLVLHRTCNEVQRAAERTEAREGDTGTVAGTIARCVFGLECIYSLEVFVSTEMCGERGRQGLKLTYDDSADVSESNLPSGANTPAMMSA